MKKGEKKTNYPILKTFMISQEMHDYIKQLEINLSEICRAALEHEIEKQNKTIRISK